MISTASSRETKSLQSSISSTLQPATKSKAVAVIGSINMDYILRVPRFPRTSETLHTESLDRIPGGKGAMQALACYKLLRRPVRERRRSSKSSDNVEIVVELHARVGADRTGKEADQAGMDILQALRDWGLTTRHIQVVPDIDTGRAFITVSAETGENYVVLFAGANRAPNYPIPFPRNMPDLCIFQLEIEAETVWSHIRTAKDGGAKVLLNAAPASENIPFDIWQNLDHLIVNRLEADILIRSHCDHSIEIKDINDMSRPELVDRYQKFCKLFLDKGVQNVVITLSENGCVAGSITVDGEDLIIDHKVEKVEKSVDRTGAGGVFIGAYAVNYVKRTAGGRSFDIKEAVEWASDAARLSLQDHGSIDGIPTGDQIGSL